MPIVIVCAVAVLLRPTCQDPAPTAPIVIGTVSPAATALRESADAIRTQVAAICGRQFRGEVTVSVLSPAAMRGYTMRRVDLELGEGRLERMEGWLRCLALLQAGQGYRDAVTALLTGQMAGVYDAQNKVLHLLDDRGNVDDWYARYTIAHELSHALDDQQLGLHRLLMPPGHELTKDQLFAIGGAVEGSAIAVSDAWAARSPPAPDYDPMASPEARESATKANAALLAAPPYCTLQLGRHILGRMFFAAGRELRRITDGEYLGLLSIADDLPMSTEQILHPQKYWDTEARDEPVVLANEDAIAATIAAATGTQVLDRNTLGELIVALLAQPIDRKLNPAATRRLETWTNAAATGWGGDRLFLLGSAGGAAAEPVIDPGVVWVTAWDTETDRDEFLAAATRHRGEQPGFAHAAAGRTAVFAFAGARKIETKALLALLARCRFEQAGKPWNP